MMVVAVVRGDNVVSLEVVSRNPFSLRMLLSSSSTRVEKVVYRLKGPSTLTRHLLILVCKRIL